MKQDLTIHCLCACWCSDRSANKKRILYDIFVNNLLPIFILWFCPAIILIFHFSLWTVDRLYDTKFQCFTDYTRCLLQDRTNLEPSIPGRLSHFAVHWPLTDCAVLGLMTIHSVPHKMGLTWSSLTIPGALSHFAVHWALTASAVLALTHDSDVPEVHSAVLYVPYEPVPPETGDCISKIKLLLWS